MFLRSIFVICFSFLLVSCGQEKSQTTKRRIKLQENQIAYIMENQQFSCDSIDGSDCPAGIARLFIFNRYKPSNSAVCSGFMVSRDTLVTNNHCVKNAKACKDTYIAIYNGYSHETVKCKSIIAVGRDSKNPNNPRKSLDFTVMKISQDYTGEYFEVGQRAPKAFTEVNAWVVDHTGLDKYNANPFESRITQFKCQIKNQNKYRSVMLENCPVISGNSGSPVIDENARVVGIIWGSVISDLRSSTPLILRRNSDVEALMTDVRFFRNYLP